LGTWLSDANRWWKHVRQWLSVDRAVLATAGDQGVPIAGVLAVRGIPGASLQRWLEQGGQDAMLQSAGEHGQASTKAGSRGGLPWDAGSTLWVTLPTAHQGLKGSLTNRWALGLARKSQPFDEAALHTAGLLLRELVATFESPSRRNGHNGEPGLARAVLDENGQLLAGDLGAAAALLQDPDLLIQRWDAGQQVVSQRWRKPKEGHGHDLVLDLGDGRGPVWLRLGWRKPASGLTAARVLECRPVDEHAMPAAGLVDDPRIAEVIGQLSDHVSNPPRLNELAERVKASPFHFLRRFQQQAGLTPKQFTLRAQIMRSRWLLRATDLSIGQIGELGGFGSHGHFTATFTRMTGQSPSDYRERFR
jgi:AraC-like DNA-binding protein